MIGFLMLLNVYFDFWSKIYIGLCFLCWLLGQHCAHALRWACPHSCTWWNSKNVGCEDGHLCCYCRTLFKCSSLYGIWWLHWYLGCWRQRCVCHLQFLSRFYMHASEQRSLLGCHLLITDMLCFWLHFHNLNS